MKPGIDNVVTIVTRFGGGSGQAPREVSPRVPRRTNGVALPSPYDFGTLRTLPVTDRCGPVEPAGALRMIKHGCSFLIGWIVVICGCSDDTQPAQPEIQPTAEPTRSYAPLPPDLLIPPTFASERIPPFRELEQALSAMELDRAREIIQAAAKASPDARLANVQMGLALVSRLVGEESREIRQAETILNELATSVRDAALPQTVRQEWSWWNLVVHIHRARRAALDDAASFRNWSETLAGLLEQMPDPPRDPSALVDAVDRLIAPVDERPGSVTERLERILVDLQRGLAWADVMTPIQQRRVTLLTNAGRISAARFEARILLALSSQDAVALPKAIDQAARLFASDTGGESDKNVRAVLQSGPSPETTNPLVEMHRSYAYLETQVGTLTDADETLPSEQIDAAYAMLLAGRFREAIDRLTHIVRSHDSASDSDLRRTLDGLAMAYSGLDGHTSACGRFAPKLAAGEDSWQGASPVWRHAAMRFHHRRMSLIQKLIVNGQIELALGLSAGAADAWAGSARGRRPLDLALQACQSASAGQKAGVDLQRFAEFGRRLVRPQALARQALLSAKEYVAAGQVAEALGELERVRATTGDPIPDPDVAFLYAYCLLRARRAAEALPRLERLAQRPDLARGSAAQTQLLIGAIYLQQGRTTDARQALRRIGDREPNGSFAARAKKILDRI